MLRWYGSYGKAEDSGLKGLGFNPLPRQDNFSCFQLVASEPMRSAVKVFARLLQMHVIIVTEMEKKVSSFLKTCPSPCFYSGNRWLRNIQTTTTLFTDVHGPWTSKNADLLESLTENVSLRTISNMNWSRYRANGSSLKKKDLLKEII